MVGRLAGHCAVPPATLGREQERRQTVIDDPDDDSDDGHAGPAVVRLPDRRRNVAPSLELDSAISELLELVRFVKSRRHRGPLTRHEAHLVEAVLARGASHLEEAVHKALGLPHP